MKQVTSIQATKKNKKKKKKKKTQRILALQYTQIITDRDTQT